MNEAFLGVSINAGSRKLFAESRAKVRLGDAGVRQSVNQSILYF